MLNTLHASRGMVVAPHHLAAQSGLAVLREGGNAVEAMVAAAATVAVVYPHMNSIGGDGFWLIAEPGKPPVAVDACGGAANLADIAFYKDQGLSDIPFRGPLAALTAAGTISGWDKALEIAGGWGKAIPLSRLLADAIEYAADGFPVTASQISNVAEKLPELVNVAGFKNLFCDQDQHSGPFKNAPLAATFRQLAEAGLQDYYRGDLARSMARDLEAVGSPLRLPDFERHEAKIVTPLSVNLSCGEVFNLPPPTQGIASLLILALYDRIRAEQADGFDHVHRLVEATKAAFRVRDHVAIDPRYLDAPASDYLTESFIAKVAIDLQQAEIWPTPAPSTGDTIWMGAIDAQGRAVSFIQSIYWEFGSGVVLRESGVNWQNRGTSFSLNPASRNPLMPGRKPFHTLNPAFARLSDGRAMVYGTMGGDGQPQTQAAVFSRIAMHGADPQAAITSPRWLLGRTWGSASTSLKLESRFSEGTQRALRAAGHDVEVLPEFTSAMGHAGAIVLSGDGRLSGASDPRSDGLVAAY